MSDGYLSFNAVVGRDGYQPARERINLQLPKDIVVYLREESERTYSTMTGLILDSIQLKKYLNEQTKKGAKIIIQDADGGQREIIWF